MDNHHICVNDDTVLRLEFLEAIHPALVHLRADHWKFIYQLFHNQALFDRGLFNDIFFVCEQRQVLIIEEYDKSILDNEQIEVDEDVIRNLRLFDFRRNKTGKFSKLTGDSFLLHRFAGNNFIFSKQYTERTVTFEIDVNNIGLVDFGVL